jgi:hypothetical protein
LNQIYELIARQLALISGVLAASDIMLNPKKKKIELKYNSSVLE